MKNECLLIPEKEDVERIALATVWEEMGGDVLRIGKFWEKPTVHNKRVTIYGNDTFVLVLAHVLGLQLVTPKDEMIAEVATEFVQRRIDIYSIENIRYHSFPKFVKPVRPKLFNAAVFPTFETLKNELNALEKDELLICSEVVFVEKEVRAFILNLQIMDLAYYEGQGEIESPQLFIIFFLKHCRRMLPKSFVLDVGYNAQKGWFIIEFNSSWGAGLNFCRPEKVIECIRAATIN